MFEADIVNENIQLQTFMHQRLRSIFKQLLLFVAYGSLGVVLTLLVFFVHQLESRQNLEPWHLADLSEEFTEHSSISSFEQYLALEDRLFGQLDRAVYDQTGPVEDDYSNRYKRGSFADPQRWNQNWNRSYELASPQPRAVVLLLHGLSDSPYSLRGIGQDLNEAGYHVLGLRVPGHGTAPSSLVTISWQDMAAAVEIMMRDLNSRFPDQPIHIVGYSHGAALALHYSLSALDNKDLPKADRLVLLSPEIGVSPLAAFAVWQARLGNLLGFKKLAWNEILPEYDPYKYGSFAINAGDVSYRLTEEVRRQLEQSLRDDTLVDLPSILAFSSVVDATVRAPSLVSGLFNRLEPGDHELVLYDINRWAGLRVLYRSPNREVLEALPPDAERSFRLSLLTNRNTGSFEVIVRTWAQNSLNFAEEDPGLLWPDDLFSLSHVALPFSIEDPLYGGTPAEGNPGTALGTLALRGERGVLQVTPGAMLRQRWNPFYDYQQKRILEFLSANADR